MTHAPIKPSRTHNRSPNKGGSMTTDTGAIAKLAAAVEQQRIAQEAAKQEADYLKKLAFRRNLCWVAAGGFFLTAGFITIDVWTGRASVPVGVISWLGPGFTTFSILGGIAIQKVINRRMITARIEEAETRLREEIRDARPPDAIELARIATMVQQVAATQTRLAERLDAIEAIAHSIVDPASNFTQYLAACDDLRRDHGSGAG